MVKKSSFTEMCHILGLGDNPEDEKPHEGLTTLEATACTQNRYKQFNPNSKLQFTTITWISRGEVSAISKLKDGGYVGFNAGWEEHAFSIHAVKEGDSTHFIYVNRGAPHNTGKRTEEARTVLVFTIPNEKAKEFAKEMTEVAKKEKRASMSLFLNKHQDKVNPILSAGFVKTKQKAGNCTIANANIAWHFQLASDRMQESIKKKQPISLLEAYQETQDSYKTMRLCDRIEAYRYLLDQRKEFQTPRAYFYDYIQPLVKFKNREQIEVFVNAVKTEPKRLLALTEPLLDSNFEKNTNYYIKEKIKYIQQNRLLTMEQKEIDGLRDELRKEIDSTKHQVLEHSFKYLDREKQIEVINKKISLLQYATEEIQTSFLKTDFEKYAAYSSPKVHSSFLVDNDRAVQISENSSAVLEEMGGEDKSTGEICADFKRRLKELEQEQELKQENDIQPSSPSC